MARFSILTNRKRAIVALVHSVVFLLIAVRQMVAANPAPGIWSPSMVPTGTWILCGIFAVVTSILLWLLVISRGWMEKFYFRILYHQRWIRPPANCRRRSDFSRRPLHKSGYADQRGSGWAPDRSQTLPQGFGRSCHPLGIRREQFVSCSAGVLPASPREANESALGTGCLFPLAVNCKLRCIKVYDRGMGRAAVPDVTAFILAGGKGTRMGANKAFVQLQGRSLLERTLDMARSATSQVCIVGSREKFARFAPLVEDIFRNCGPLGGIHAALRASTTDVNLMLAVDMPFVPSAFLKYLIQQARDSPGATAVLPRSNGRWQPLCAIYRRDFADVAEKALQASRNRIDLLYPEIRSRVIEEEELRREGFSPEIFGNLNTPEELAEQRRS
ncbi:MAG: molybdenum cofactor guanylyltransferase [Candidatus Sulfotelmatobacter sp.]